MLASEKMYTSAILPSEFLGRLRDSSDTASSIDTRSESVSEESIVSTSTTSGSELLEIPRTVQVTCEVRNAYREEIENICHWRRREFGLRSHLNFLKTLYDCDPLGWFVSLNEKGDIIGNIYAMNFSPNIAFGGLYGVEKSYRCQGIGGMLWNVRLNHVGERNFVVNAVETRLKPNIKQGMKPSFKMATYIGYLNGQKVNNYLTSTQSIHDHNKTSGIELIRLKPEFTKNYPGLLDALISYDATICQFARPLYMKDTIRHFENTLTVVAIDRTTQPSSLVENGNYNILGYGILRPKYIGHTIGPLYATSPAVATSILRTLVSAVPFDNWSEVNSEPFDLTIIEEDFGGEIEYVAKNLITQLKLAKEYLLYRMYSKEEIPLPLNKVYAITCTESFLL